MKRAFENQNPGDFQGYVFNIRNPKFKDIRVRQAIGLAFDFEWLNKQLFYGLYKRVQGYYPNSEFHAEGLPKPDELALLEPLRDKLRPEVFGPAADLAEHGAAGQPAREPAPRAHAAGRGRLDLPRRRPAQRRRTRSSRSSS